MGGVARDLEIRKFVPKDYWLVKATFQAKAGNYVGVWFDAAAAKDADKPERIWEQAKAEQYGRGAPGKFRSCDGSIQTGKPE